MFFLLKNLINIKIKYKKIIFLAKLLEIFIKKKKKNIVNLEPRKINIFIFSVFIVKKNDKSDKIIILWLNNFISTIKKTGKIFIKVMKKQKFFIFKIEKKLINQKWNGGKPIFINKENIINFGIKKKIWKIIIMKILE